MRLFVEQGLDADLVWLIVVQVIGRSKKAEADTSHTTVLAR
jgi:hypothetical protein